MWAAKGEPNDMNADIATVRHAIITELDKGTDVILLAHSYGGYPALSACKGLDTKTRQAKGEATSVLGISIIAGFLVPEGSSQYDLGDGLPAPIHDVQGDMLYINDPPGPILAFYNDLPIEEANKWAAMLVPQAWVTNKGKATYSAYEDIPTSYLVCKNDQALPAFIQTMFVDDARASGANVQAYECDSGHSPFLSMVPEFGDWVRMIAGEEVSTTFVPY